MASSNLPPLSGDINKDLSPLTGDIEKDLGPAQSQGGPLQRFADWRPPNTMPPAASTLPMMLGPAGGLAGALGRIGAAGLGGAIDQKSPLGAVGPAAGATAVEGAAPALGVLLRMLPGIRQALPVTPKVTDSQTLWSHSPWVGQSVPQGMTPSVHAGPVTQTVRSVETGGRPYLPNLPPMLRALIESIAGGAMAPRQGNERTE